MAAGASTLHDLATRAQMRVGQIIKDKWRLDQLLGVGGMAAVYAATHRNKKRFAMKILHQEYSRDQEVRARFLQEGYAANHIEHPGAVSVIDDEVTEDGAAFLVMELLIGETLEARWSRHGQRLDPGEVVAYIDQLLDVLAAAHAKGVVHRDIKPENIFLTKEGQIKVLDFGIARIFETTQQAGKMTRAGEVMGTPAFMAPEQALARWDQVDGRTDLYSVGASMFTLMSGRCVHEAQSGTEQLVRTATTPARSLSDVVQGLPPAVVTVVDRALSFRKEHRWPDARSMQGAARAARASLGPKREPAVAVASSQALPAVPDSLPSMPSVRDLNDPVAIQAHLAQRHAELDQRAREHEALQPVIAEIQRRATATREKVTAARAKVQSARNERAALEQFFKQHVGTRATAAEEARKQLNGHFSQFARSVIQDTNLFGEEFNAAREEIAQLTAVAEAAQRDVLVHRAALKAYDESTVTKGVALVAVATLVFLVLFFMPVILRFTAN
jgi:serine/threonine-protein kinase